MRRQKSATAKRGACWIAIACLAAGCNASSADGAAKTDASNTAGDATTGGASGPSNNGPGSDASAQGSTDAESGSTAGGDASASSGTVSSDACDDPSLVWKTAAKTNYESYPAPGSDECVKYSGCDYLGQFQACDNTMPESWVKTHNIVSVFPLAGLELHNLCLRSGSKTIVVTAIDTCGDTDCGGCCTENKGSADRLIDIEKYTDARFGVDDGEIEWADLGAGDHGFDGCN